MLTLSPRVFLGMGIVAWAARLGAAELWEDKTAQHFAVTDSRMVVSGLAWFSEEKPVLRRLPSRMKDVLPPKVWGLAQSPSGARIRFVTDTATIAVVAQVQAPVMGWAANTANSGLDLYVDGGYYGSAPADAEGVIRKEWSIGKERKLREITLYLPMAKSIEVRDILLDHAAVVEAPRPFALAKPVVYYGSSITQGAGTSNPGLVYPALLSRWLNVDFVNLGFSGNGFGEPALARAVAEIDAACFVVDYWANPSAAVYRDTLPGFIAILREKHPLTPIIVTGPYYNPSEDQPGEAGQRQIEKRVIAREFVAARRKAGDKHIVHVDGLEMLSKAEADGLRDARHANSMGCYFCAKGLEPYMRQALGLPAVDGKRK